MISFYLGFTSRCFFFSVLIDLPYSQLEQIKHAKVLKNVKFLNAKSHDSNSAQFCLKEFIEMTITAITANRSLQTNLDDFQ